MVYVSHAFMFGNTKLNITFNIKTRIPCLSILI